MINVDSRIGSGELAARFLDYGVQPVRTKLEFGDFSFTGKGPNGCEVLVAIERKKIFDLLSCIKDKRLAGHQLPGLSDNYDYCYLIVEGLWRPAKDGTLELFNRTWKPTGFSFRAVDSFLSGLELRCGIIYRRTQSALETVQTTVSLYRNWQKPWDEHTSHLEIYAPVVVRRKFRLDAPKLRRVDRVAVQLPGVGTKTGLVVQHFKSIKRMINADAAAWCEIDGFGPAGAKKIIEAIEEEE